MTLHLFRYLNFDVVAVALACGSAASFFCGASLPYSWYIALALSVWCVYTADRIFDVERIRNKPASERHRFHLRHRATLLRALVLVAGADLAVVALFFPLEWLLLGFGIVVLCALHFGITMAVRDRVSLLLQKEAAVALIFTAGLWAIPAWELRPGRSELLAGAGAAIFFLLVLLNLMVLAWYEAEEDERDGSSSFVRALGRRKAAHVIQGIAAAAVAGSVALMVASPPRLMPVGATFAVIGAILPGMLYSESALRNNRAYRLAADALFLLPGLAPLADKLL